MRRLALAPVLAAACLVGCAAWKQCAYESAGRDAWQKPEQVVAALGIAPGDVVADLGSGSGYFTLRLARAVGETGSVYASDVDEAMNERLEARLAEEGLSQVRVVRADYDDPNLPDGAIDLLFSSNTYHHMQSRPEYFRRLKRDLAPGGRVAIVDYDGSHGWFVRLMGHYVEPDVLLREMREAGYRVERQHEFLERQSFVIFAPEEGDAAHP